MAVKSATATDEGASHSGSYGKGGWALQFCLGIVSLEADNHLSSHYLCCP